MKMEGDEHMMMDWWGIHYIGWYIMIGIWIVFLILAILISADAGKRGMNSGLWFLLTVLPCIGIISAIIYMLVRDDYPVQPRYNEHSPVQPVTHSIPIEEAL
ncbi:MAG: hypothetical protein ACTSPI_17760, partial [Candidatus Heimdallarchaeaceae archaeon]